LSTIVTDAEVAWNISLHGLCLPRWNSALPSFLLRTLHQNRHHFFSSTLKSVFAILSLKSLFSGRSLPLIKCFFFHVLSSSLFYLFPIYESVKKLNTGIQQDLLVAYMCFLKTTHRITSPYKIIFFLMKEPFFILK
jgi:hypothetical protein